MADVEALAYANRIYAAELIVPDLLLACPLQLDLDVLRGCAALALWDWRADLHSRGAVLFREFWNSAALIEDKWAVPFDPADPVNTPRGMKPSAAPAIFAALKGAVRTMRELGIPLDRRLADLHTALHDQIVAGAAVLAVRDQARSELFADAPDGIGDQDSLKART